MTNIAQHICRRSRDSRGVAAVELALVLPILLIVLFGMLDFGLYLYNDLRLTHVARDAARFLSVGDEGEAQNTIENANELLVSTTIDTQGLDPGDTGEDATVTLTATYQMLTPIYVLVPNIDGTLGIDATAIMRRE